MAERGIEDRFKAELLMARADNFRTGATLRSRLLEDYQKDPELLAVDVAWAMMAALCLAQAAGVALDLDAAVTAGKRLYEREGFSDAAAAPQVPA